MNNRVMLTDRVAKQARPADKEYLTHDLALKGFGLRVRPSGAKSWVLRLAIDGKMQRRTLGNPTTLSAEDARAKAHALLAERQTEASTVEIIRPTAPTFEAFTDLYLARKVRLQKPSGQRSVKIYLRCTLLPAFQGMPLDRIRRADVARWFYDYGERRPGGANRALAILSNMFNCARDWGVLAENAVNSSLLLELAFSCAKERQTEGAPWSIATGEWCRGLFHYGHGLGLILWYVFAWSTSGPNSADCLARQSAVAHQLTDRGMTYH